MGASLSGVGVLDKAMAIVDALEASPLTLAELTAVTGLPRATAHRLATALEAHTLIGRDPEGRYCLGARFTRRLWVEASRPALERLRDETGESVQLYVRRGDDRVCLVSLESPHSLRTIVPVGAHLPLDRGSAGRVLRGERVWAETVEEREKGVASVSAAVHGGDGDVIAAVSVSGPVERTTRAPGRRYRRAVERAARAIEASLP